MKKFFKAIFSPMKKPLFGIIALILGAAALAVCLLVPKLYFGGITTAQFQYPIVAASSANGLTAVNDLGSMIYCIDSDGESIRYIISGNDLNYSTFKFGEIVFDQNDNLYLQIAVFNDDAYLTDYDLIWQFDSYGNFVREICHYEYINSPNPPHRGSCISALNIKDNKLRYVYNVDDFNISLISTELSSTEFETEATLSCDNYVGYLTINTMDDANYVAIRTNGDIGIISTDGTFTKLHGADYTADDCMNGFLANFISSVNGEIYVCEGIESDEIYTVSDGSAELFLNVSDLCSDDDFYTYFGGMFSLYGKPAFPISNAIYIINEDGTADCMSGGYTLPIELSVSVIVLTILPFVCGVLIITGLISCIGCLMKWRLSLLSKQLLLTLPLVIFMLGAVIVSMLKGIYNNYYSTMNQQMIAINQLSVKMLDGDEIEKMTTVDCVEDGSLYRLYSKLNELIENNKGVWNKTFDNSIYLIRDDGINVMLATGAVYTMPFQTYSYGDIDYENNVTEDSNTIILDAYTSIDSFILADTPIYNSDGEMIAIYELSADTSTFSDNIAEICRQMLFQVLCYIPIFIAAVTIITLFSIRYLRKASGVVARIANGDFSARIEKSPNDEVGEICIGVNNMAGQLEQFFSEKDKNEKFYYKFVPEKFRELLHKENFTDLSLGDAESADLTVLFCDIRSFSITSEMMTAKENFEFVNIIYGKAGPIVRNHGGFVDKYIGDAVMALFENADAAVAAGTQLYHEIVINPDTAENLGVSSINIGIGIHSGMARIGIVGEDERMSGTVISNTVNLSSRLESLTKKYNTAMLISKDTLDRMSAPDDLNTRYLGMVQVAGVNEVKALYEVLDCLDESRRVQREKTKTEFKEAVRLFHLGDLKAAADMFGSIAGSPETDPVPRMYQKFIEDKLKNNDFEHNFFRFNRK